jgi:hypothetical protein
MICLRSLDKAAYFSEVVLLIYMKHALKNSTILLLLLSLVSMGKQLRAQSGVKPQLWIATWGASQQTPEPQNALATDDLRDATVRQIFHLSAGGAEVRVHLSNAFGTQALHFTSVHIARPLSATSAAIDLFIRGTRVVHGALLLNKGGGVQVHRCGVPTLHIGDRHLRSEAGLQDTLRLHLGHLLRFCRVQEIELFNLAVRSTAAIKLLRGERAVRLSILCPCGPVLTDSSETVPGGGIGQLKRSSRSYLCWPTSL